MPQGFRRWGAHLLAWLVLTTLGGFALARYEVGRLRDAFETDARIAHRLLSQRAVQHEAVLATLALLQPTDVQRPEQRLPSLYPQILAVQRRTSDEAWPDARLRAAEVVSRAVKRATLAQLDFMTGHYSLVLAAEPTSYALRMDLAAVVPWAEWPMSPQGSPVRVTLEQDSQTFVLQQGHLRDGGWHFEFRKHLAAESQPFELVALHAVGWRDLPWLWLIGWALLVAGALAALGAWQRQRAQRLRAEELLRLGQVARLNALGELAAGMAHELNQPLTALLASTQAAGRLLDEDPPELALARSGMRQAVEQARRAAQVIGRLRRAVERPDQNAPLQPVVLQDAVRNVLYLLEPEFSRYALTPKLHAPAAPIQVLANAVALEQIIHNLLVNALQALERVPASQRQLDLTLAQDEGRATLTVADTGPGIAPDVLLRMFEPFFSTREGGLGLGLSLCETLAGGMGGQLEAGHNHPSGAVLRLTLPLMAVGASA